MSIFGGFVVVVVVVVIVVVVVVVVVSQIFFQSRIRFGTLWEKRAGLIPGKIRMRGFPMPVV